MKLSKRMVFSIFLLSLIGLTLDAQVGTIEEEKPPSNSELESMQLFKSEVGVILNGQKEGEWKYYYPLEETNHRPKIRAVGNYQNGIKNGEWQYLGLNPFYKDTIANYKDGIPDGVWKILSIGKIFTEIEYSNGKQVKKTDIRYGELFSIEKTLEDGTREFIRYSDSLIWQTKYFNTDSLKIGEWLTYEGENLHFIEYYNNDILMAKNWYFPDGQLSAENKYEPELYGIGYYDNGQIEFESIYKNKIQFNKRYYTREGKERDNGGFKDGNGVLFIYDSEGFILGERTYKNQVMVEHEWYPTKKSHEEKK